MGIDKLSSSEVDIKVLALDKLNENPEYQNIKPIKTQNTDNEDTKELITPRSERRGLLSQFCLLHEYRDPRNYPPLMKHYIVTLIAISAGVGSIYTSLSYPAMDQITADLRTTRMNINVTVGLFILALGVFPLWWSQFSERFGRRSIYVISFLLFWAFTLCCAFCKDITSFAVLRTLSGASCASVLSVGAGTISDIYDPEQRGEALGYYYLGPLIAPLLAPIIGSLLLIQWNWRATQWFLVIFSGILVIAIIFTLPETLRMQDIHKTERQIKEEETLAELKGFTRFKYESYLVVIRPLKSLKLLKCLPVLLVIQQGSFLFCILYLATLGVQYEFARPPYNWKTLYVGFGYSPQTIAFIICSVFGGKWNDRLLKKFQEKNGYYAPECRISYNVVLGAVKLPISSLIIGWCFHFHTYWVTPLIGTSIFGIALPMLTGPINTYLVDSLPGRGATGIAVHDFVRSFFATLAIFLFDPMVKGLKFGPMMTLFAGFGILSSLALIYLKKNGEKYRETYDFEKLYASLD